MTAPAASATPTARPRAGAIVTAQELRDLWIGGRGLVLILAFSVLLSVISYLAATNQALNFLEQQESVNLAVQVAITAGSLLVLLVAADAISGERERGTLENMLLTPVSRAGIVGGKLAAALSLWGACFVISIPYVWFLARGIDLVAEAIAAGLLVGTLVAVFLGSLGAIISTFSGSNRISLSVSLFILLALFAPTQLPSSATRGWFGNALERVNPVTSGDHFVGRVLVNGDSWGSRADWLVSPIVGALVLPCVAAFVGARFMRLGRGVGG